MRDIDAALGQHFLDIEQAQREAMATTGRTANRTLIAYDFN